jgi:hypothetical protein
LNDLLLLRVIHSHIVISEQNKVTVDIEFLLEVLHKVCSEANVRLKTLREPLRVENKFFDKPDSPCLVRLQVSPKLECVRNRFNVKVFSHVRINPLKYLESS